MNYQPHKESNEERIVVALERIAEALSMLADCTDDGKRAVRMFDVERANVYKTHLGEKMRDTSPVSTPTQAPTATEEKPKAGIGPSRTVTNFLPTEGCGEP